jgi:phosphate transport system permease protein
MGAFALILLYILVKGALALSTDMFRLEYTSTNLSMLPALIGTLYIALMSLAIAMPIGIMAAIYLTEYAHQSNPLVKFIRLITESLQGIPSIVYGLFGYIVFVVTVGFGYSIIAGALTMAIIILPVIIRGTEEGILAVPTGYRQGSFAVGASRLRTVIKIVLPSALPAILSATMLALGRLVGESAPLIFTAGTGTTIPTTPLDSARTLSVHMYALLTEGLHTDEAYGTAVILIVLVAALNGLSALVHRRWNRGRN